MREFLEIYKYRSLIFALVARHIATRYRGSALGFLWSLLNPLFLMLIYTLVFKYYIRFQQDNYSLYVFCGLLPWIWMSSGLIESTNSIVASGHLITKSMFPPQILPVVSIVTNLVHFLLSLILLLIFMVIYKVPITIAVLFLPVVILLQFLFIYALGLLLASLNVKFRDVQHLLGNLLSLLFFLCPVVYPASSVPEQFRFTLEINPFAGLIVMYQQILLDGRFPDMKILGLVTVLTVLITIAATSVFRRHREHIAEML
jgi:lipopolysaccharide transport system permease protein